jgi:4a-hydroxytetrahydrobiopterin dehydratase
MTRPSLLDPAAVTALVASLPGWTLAADGKAIVRRFRFPEFDATMKFVNALADVARQHDHHPDMKVG